MGDAGHDPTLAGGVSEGPDIAGRLTADGHVLPIRIYFEDTDFSGTVYHGAYVRFLERGRSDFIRLLGVSHSELDDEGLVFAVSEMKLAFRRPARIDDIVEVTTHAARLSGARVVLAQTVRRGSELLVEATVTVALVDRRGKPKRFPEAVRHAFAAPINAP